MFFYLKCKRIQSENFTFFYVKLFFFFKFITEMILIKCLVLKPNFRDYLQNGKGVHIKKKT